MSYTFNPFSGKLDYFESSTASSGITIGTTTITSGTDGRVLYDNNGVVGENANLFFDDTTNASFLQLGSGTAPGALRLLEGSGTGTSVGILTVPTSLTSDRTYTFPNASGTVALTSDIPSGLTVGTTTIASGTDTKVLFDNAGVLGEYTISGSGNVAMTTSPSFTTPALGAATGTSLALSAATSLTIGTASSLTGSIVFQNATNANTLTLKSGVTSASYTITLPTAVGGANTVLTDVAGNGVLSWAAGGSGADTALSNITAVSMPADVIVGFGTTTAFGGLEWNTTQTVDTMMLLTGTTSNHIVIAERADAGFDFAHAQQTNPTLFVHSAAQSTTQWTSMTHDGTNAVFGMGTGSVKFTSAGTKNLIFDIAAFGSGTVTVTVPFISGLTMASQNNDNMFVRQTMAAGTGIFMPGTGSWGFDISAAQTPDSWVFLTDNTVNHWLFIQNGDYNFDFAHGNDTDPTIYIHSHNQNTTQWIGISHNAANGVVNTGLGPVALTNGAAVASATALPLPTGNVFHVTGTTNITSITSTGFSGGMIITLIFDDVLTFTDGNNLILAGNFVTTANDTITLAYDGTNFYEVARSVN